MGTKREESIPVVEYEYVNCRSFGHRWRIGGINTHGHHYMLWLRCDECTMVRQDQVDSLTGAGAGAELRRPREVQEPRPLRPI